MSASQISSLVLDPRSFPVLKPHISCVGTDVYFGSFPLAQLTPVEAEFLRACTGDRSLADSARIANADAACVARLSSWLLWWGRPVLSAAISPGPVARLVLGARHSAPWLGMGGRTLIEAPGLRTLVVNCFGSLGDSPFVDAFPSLSEVSAASRDEAALLSRLAGVQHSIWEFPDSMLRETLVDSGRDVETLAATALQNQLLALIASLRPSQIFAPAALDGSPDAVLLFESMLSAFAGGLFEGELHFYEDVPPLDGYRAIDEFMSRFENSYLSPRAYDVDITSAFQEKSALVSALRCNIGQQSGNAWLQSATLRGALASPPVPYAERFWRLDVASIC